MFLFLTDPESSYSWTQHSCHVTTCIWPSVRLSCPLIGQYQWSWPLIGQHIPHAPSLVSGQYDPARNLICVLVATSDTNTIITNIANNIPIWHLERNHLPPCILKACLWCLVDHVSVSSHRMTWSGWMKEVFDLWLCDLTFNNNQISESQFNPLYFCCSIRGWISLSLVNFCTLSLANLSTIKTCSGLIYSSR